MNEKGQRAPLPSSAIDSQVDPVVPTLCGSFAWRALLVLGVVSSHFLFAAEPIKPTVKSLQPTKVIAPQGKTDSAGTDGLVSGDGVKSPECPPQPSIVKLKEKEDVGVAEVETPQGESVPAASDSSASTDLALRIKSRDQLVKDEIQTPTDERTNPGAPPAKCQEAGSPSIRLEQKKECEDSDSAASVAQCKRAEPSQPKNQPSPSN